jgi:hypothetical protein
MSDRIHRSFSILNSQFSILALSLLFAAPAFCAESDPAATDIPQTKDPLAGKQQIVRDRMTQLEDRMFRLSEKLNKAEPDQAKRLNAALQQARELLIRRNMDEAIAMLEAGKLSDAADRQNSVSKDLERVLKLLLEDPDNSKEKREEIDRLKAYREKVKELLESERKLKAQADAAPRLEQLLAAVQAAIAKLEGLIDRQQKVNEKTATAEQSNDKPAADKLGESQQQIRSETESLAEKLSRPLAAPPTEADAQKSPAASDQPPSNQAKDGEKSPSAQTAPAESKQDPAATQPEDSHDHEKEHAEAKPEKSENAPAPPEAAIESGMRKAGQDVDKAGGAMKTAENQLQNKDLPKTLPQQKKAVDSLKSALEQLKKQEAAAREQLPIVS